MGATDDEELLPSEVRARILKDHERIRAAIGAVRQAARDSRDNGHFRRFREVAQELLTMVDRHLDLEDEILMPTLRTIDAWGPHRAERLSAEHQSQRVVLEKARQELTRAGRATIDVVAGMEEFTNRLEKDMELEEKTSLDEELLREFPMPVDFGGA